MRLTLLMRLNLPAQPPGVGAGQTRGSSRIEEGWSPGQWGLWGPEMTPVLHGIGQGSERAPAPTQTPVCPHPDAWLGAAGEGVGGEDMCALLKGLTPAGTLCQHRERGLVLRPRGSGSLWRRGVLGVAASCCALGSYFYFPARASRSRLCN